MSFPNLPNVSPITEFITLGEVFLARISMFNLCDRQQVMLAFNSFSSSQIVYLEFVENPDMRDEVLFS